MKNGTKLIALKNFYNANGMPRGIISRGKPFETTSIHAKTLIQKGIAKEPGKNEPAEQPAIIPDNKENPASVGPDEIQVNEPTTKEEAGISEQIEQLEEKTASELKDIAAEKGIKGYKSMTKAELIAALKGDESL